MVAAERARCRRARRAHRRQHRLFRPRAAQGRHAGRAGLGEGCDRGGAGRRHRHARRFLLDAACRAGDAARGPRGLRRGVPAVLEVARADREDARDVLAGRAGHSARRRSRAPPRAASPRRCSRATARTSRRRKIPEIEIDARFTVSGNEVLRGKDFAQMTAAEIAEAKRAIAALRLPVRHGARRAASGPIRAAAASIRAP